MRQGGEGGEADGASQKAAGPRLVAREVADCCWRGCGAVVVVLGWGRTAVVSERSSSEMAGQQLPSASDQGARRQWPRANGALLPLSSRIVDVGGCCATREQQQANAGQRACNASCLMGVCNITVVCQPRLRPPSRQQRPACRRQPGACTPDLHTATAWSRSLLYLHASQTRTLCSQMIICLRRLLPSLGSPCPFPRPGTGGR